MVPERHQRGTSVRVRGGKERGEAGGRQGRKGGVDCFSCASMHIDVSECKLAGEKSLEGRLGYPLPAG